MAPLLGIIDIYYSICSKNFLSDLCACHANTKIDPNRKIQLDYTRSWMESLFLYLQQFTKIVLDYTKHCNLSFRKIKWQITGFGPLSIKGEIIFPMRSIIKISKLLWTFKDQIIHMGPYIVCRMITSAARGTKSFVFFVFFQKSLYFWKEIIICLFALYSAFFKCWF